MYAKDQKYVMLQTNKQTNTQTQLSKWPNQRGIPEEEGSGSWSFAQAKSWSAL